MIYSKFLEKKNTIGVPAPSDGSDNELRVARYKNGKKRMEELGYNLILSKNIFDSKRGRSANAKTRGQEINDMFNNKDIDFIMCAAGGEFLVECLPFVDYDLIKKNPKYICGFSDPTGLLYSITTKCDIATIYGENFGSFGMEQLGKSEEDFLEVITGQKLSVESYEYYEEEGFEKITGLEGDNLTEPVYWYTLDDKNVDVTGRIIGGCFDIISELAGTKFDGINEFNEKYKNDGIIWYFDNCEITMEETIRTLWKFKQLDYFKYTKCIIFGRFGVKTTYFDYDTKACLEDSLSDLNIPIIYDADISHKAPCIPVINGSIAHVEVSAGKGKITYELK